MAHGFADEIGWHLEGWNTGNGIDAATGGGGGGMASSNALRYSHSRHRKHHRHRPAVSEGGRRHHHHGRRNARAASGGHVGVARHAHEPREPIPSGQKGQKRRKTHHRRARSERPRSAKSSSSDWFTIQGGTTDTEEEEEEEEANEGDGGKDQQKSESRTTEAKGRSTHRRSHGGLAKRQRSAPRHQTTAGTNQGVSSHRIVTSTDLRPACTCRHHSSNDHQRRGPADRIDGHHHHHHRHKHGKRTETPTLAQKNARGHAHPHRSSPARTHHSSDQTLFPTVSVSNGGNSDTPRHDRTRGSNVVTSLRFKSRPLPTSSNSQLRRVLMDPTGTADESVTHIGFRDGKFVRLL